MPAPIPNSPSAASTRYVDAPVSAYYSIIVNGTHYLLDAAAKVGTVRALINTSTSSVIHDNLTDLVDASEDLPILRPPQQKRIYSLTNADADDAILAANTGTGGRSPFQIGDGRNLYDFVYIGNLADTDLLAARALLAAWATPNSRIDGECFNITNDDPWLFWDFQRTVSALTGHPVRPEDVVSIPKWLGLTIGFVSEWVVWAISGGTRMPNMTREGIRFSTLIRTLNVNEAKRALGYRPTVGV
ncbi:hypothetical protein VTN00DRAFT_8380 [Thermoascus crustaceus]|uniref:uncharacterized protein n=1 Tax=Thermoascus crustaceus TaxID=5088 RepID=UPI003742995F